MTTPLDAVDWLTRSEHRVEVLEALTEGQRLRSELQELTGVSRVTSNRMLAELEDRNWIRRDNQNYEITPTGRLVIEDFRRLSDTTAMGQKLGGIQQYLPTEEFDFDLRRLGESRVTRPTEADTLAPLSRSATLVRQATQRFTPLVVNVDRLHTREAGEIEGTEKIEAVFTAEVMETILADSVMCEDTISALERGFNFYLYEGSAPITFTLFDDTVGFELNDGSGFVPALIESDDPEVLEWAEKTYNRYKRQSTPLDVDDFRA